MADVCVSIKDQMIPALRFRSFEVSRLHYFAIYADCVPTASHEKASHCEAGRFLEISIAALVTVYWNSGWSGCFRPAGDGRNRLRFLNQQSRGIRFELIVE